MRNFHELEVQRYWSLSNKLSAEEKKSEILSLINSGDYVGSRKMDGALYKFVNTEGVCELLGRGKCKNGDFANKIDNVNHLKPFFSSLPDNTCLLGEIVFPESEGSNNTTKIMGCTPHEANSRQSENKIHYYIFDVLQYDGIDLVDESIVTRIEYLNKLPKNEYIDIAEYWYGDDIITNLNLIFDAGGEGIVITKINSTYQPGKRPARQTIKIKRELTIDAVIMSYNPPIKEYTGKDIANWKYFIDGEAVTKSYYYGWAGSFNIGLYKNGVLTQIGSVAGVEDDMLAHAADFVGCVCEVSAMQVTDDYALRHPRLMRIRDDKLPEECDWAQIE